jgi:hypothetical protein
MITSNELDPNSPIGYATKTGSFVAQRQEPGAAPAMFQRATAASA